MATIENEDQAMLELSEMLYSNPDNPTPKVELLSVSQLDFSIESLKHIEEFLEEVNDHIKTDQDYIKVTMRTGAYLGEVMKRNSRIEFHWLDYKVAKETLPNFKDFPKTLGYFTILRANNGILCFPVDKVEQFLRDSSNSLYEYAHAVLGLIESKHQSP